MSTARRRSTRRVRVRRSRPHGASIGRSPSAQPATVLSLTLGMTVFIAVAVLLPVQFMSAILDPLNALLYELFPGSNVSAGKLGHTVAFFLLTWCAILLSGRSTACLVAFLGLILLYSVVTEVSQLMVDGRSPKVRDIVFDLTGVGAALLVFYFPRFLTLRDT